jgi:hypothetical protein
MTDVIKNLSKNLKEILDENKMTSTRFCEICEERGLSVRRSTLSRIFNQDANIGILLLADISAGVRSIPGYEWVTSDALIADDMRSEKVVIGYGTFASYVSRLLVDLDELSWVTLNKETADISQFAALLAKQYGIEVVKPISATHHLSKAK